MIGISVEQQRIVDLARGNSRAEQETLALLASEPAQDVKLFLGLNAFGQRHETKAMADIDCRPDQFL